jgi:hypothetical protein
MTFSEWRPIETAPVDQAVLLHSKRWGPTVGVFSSERGMWRSPGPGEAALALDKDEITHWMPLPPEPETPAQPTVVYRARIVAH